MKRERLLARGRFATDRGGYAAMVKYVRTCPRTWAVGGANGAGRPLAPRLLANGEHVVECRPSWPLGSGCSTCRRRDARPGAAPTPASLWPAPWSDPSSPVPEAVPPAMSATGRRSGRDGRGAHERASGTAGGWGARGATDAGRPARSAEQAAGTGTAPRRSRSAGGVRFFMVLSRSSGSPSEPLLPPYPGAAWPSRQYPEKVTCSFGTPRWLTRCRRTPVASADSPTAKA